MAKSKLGIHFNFVREADAMRDWLLSTRPAVALAIDPDAGFWAEIKQEAPEIFLIGRIVFDPQPWDNQVFVADTITNHPAAHIMDAWQGLNEPTRDQLVAACDLDYNVAHLLHGQNIAYVCGSWSVGVPDIEDWLRPEMLEAIRAADYIGIHAYNAPQLNTQEGLVWYILRHRLWYDTLPADCRKPLLITECGIDSGAVPWVPGDGNGWQKFVDFAGYSEQLAWFDHELQKDAYVKFAAVYQWGSLDHQWDSYDTTLGLQRLLHNHIVAQHNGEPPPEPPPVDDWQQRALAAEARVLELEAGVVEIHSLAQGLLG